MRVAPRELRGVRGNGMLVRFAMLGPVAYVEIEIPPEGSAGSGFEKPSQQAGWGFVLRGEVALHGAVERRFPVGTAFYIPPGAPDHWLSASGGALIAGFVPVSAMDGVDTEQDLQRRGYTSVTLTTAPPKLPKSIRSLEPSTVYREPGSIEVETAAMGDWLFMRTTYGPLSGYTSGWCDLPHWGLVLRGDFALRSEEGVELLSAGDVYYCPAGPPSHQFQVADSATTIDYTPFSQFDDRVMSHWRRAAWARARESGIAPPISADDVEPAPLSIKAFAPGEDDADRPSPPIVPAAVPVALVPAPVASAVRWVRPPLRGPRPAR